MKKKLISLLLALVVVIGLTVIGVAAEDTPAHTDHCVCGGGRDGRGDHVCGEALTDWTEFSADLLVSISGTEYYLPTGNYYLTQDTKLTDTTIYILPDAEVTLCLSGFDLSGNQRIFRVHGVLNISDCYLNNGAGHITGNGGGAAPVFYAMSGGHINLYGGILEAKAGSRNWGGVGALSTDKGKADSQGGSSMTMYGGNIVASNLTVTNNGGAVVLFGTSADLDGDEIKETEYACTFIQYGGTIKGAKSVGGYGSAVYGNAVDTIRIQGNDKASAIVTGDCAIAGLSGCNIVVGGSAKISDLYMRAGQIFTTQSLTGSVGLSTATNNFDVLATVTEAEVDCFTSNMPANQKLTSTAGETGYALAFAPYHADHCVCGGNLTDAAATAAHGECVANENWIPLDQETLDSMLVTSKPSDTTLQDEDGKGNSTMLRFGDEYDDACYYLTEDVSVSKPVEIHQNDNITICLNGYSWESTITNHSALRVWGTLSIADCIGSGEITSSASNTSNAPVLYMFGSHANSEKGVLVNLYGGTLKAQDTDTSTVAGVVNVNNASSVAVCTFNIYGGTITGGYGANGSVNLNSKKETSEFAICNMYGGSITNGNAATCYGGNLRVSYGEFYMYGGTMSGGIGKDGISADLEISYNNNTKCVIDGKVSIGTMVAYGGASSYQFELGENFSTDTVINLHASDSAGKIIKSATYDQLANFAALQADTYQVTCESKVICLRSVEDDYHCRCGGNLDAIAADAVGHYDCSDVKWTGLTQADVEALETTEESLNGTCYILPGGNYRLDEDITVNNALLIQISNTVNLDLNGHTLTATKTATRAVGVRGFLNLSDSAYDPATENARWGKIVGSNTAKGGQAMYVTSLQKDGDTEIGGKVFLYGGELACAFTEGSVSGPLNLSGVVHMVGGQITGLTKTTANGGAVRLNDNGSFTLWGGSVVGGEANYGGTIYSSVAEDKTHNQKVQIRGGVISGGSAKTGGNIYIGYRSALTMVAGIVSGGTSTEYGGNMYITAEAAISGGKVENGLSTGTEHSGGNICVTGGELTVSKDAVIRGGVANEGGNMSVRRNGTINITGGTIENGEALVHGGNIAVYANLNISGGLIQNGKSVERGGNISGYANTTNINISGGQIINGIVIGDGETVAADLYGANITMLSNNKCDTNYLTITGGTIGGFGEGCVEGITSVHVQSSGNEIVTTVGGTAVIDELRLGTGRMLQIAEGGFAEGASIGITRFELTGVFAPDAAADYSAYFHSTKEGISVEAVATETGYDLVLVSSIPYWAFDALNNPVGPANTIAEAMAMEGATFVRLISDYETDEVIEGDLYLDLYGHDLSGLTVNGNLYVVDYKGHNYEDGVLGKLIGYTGNMQTVYTATKDVFNVTNTYVAFANEDGSYSFHRVSVAISHVSLKPGSDALGYKATVKGDSTVLAAITGYGFNMGVEGGLVKTYTETGAPTDGVFTLRLQGIMAANGGEMTIIGQPVVYFGEVSVTGSENKTSMKETIEAIEAAVEKDPTAYTEEQMAAVKAYITDYASKMTEWNIDYIKSWTAPTTEEETTTAA